MKCRPLVLEKGEMKECEPHEATYVEFLVPSIMFEYRRLRVSGKPGPNIWVWNFDVNKPTFSPSVLSTASWAGKPWKCHSYVKNGVVQFLPDCSHENAGKMLPLKDVE